MTFTEMIQQLDETKKARRESKCRWMLYFNGTYWVDLSDIDDDDHPYQFTKDDFLATDWVLEDR
jgi:hypothetical protein